MTARLRVAVLASGGGSNLQALVDYFADDDAADIVWVGSNREMAGALARARGAGIDAMMIADPNDGVWMLSALRAARADLLVLAGYLKLVPPEVVHAFRGRVVNVHPALLPAFGGDGMFGRHVHAAVLAHGAKLSGATVHFVDEQYDRGAIIAQWPVHVFSSDTVDTLAARVLRVEHQLLPRVVVALAHGTVTLNADNRVIGNVPLPAFEELS